MYPYCLAVTPPPFPYFLADFLYRVILPPLHAPPPPQWATRAGLRYCSSYTCCACRKWLENRYRPFSLISNGFLMPVILHVILPCSLRPVGRVWLRDYYNYTCCVLQKIAPCTSSIIQYCHGMSMEFSSSTAQQSFVNLSARMREGRGGGLNCEAKASSTAQQSFVNLSA